MSHEFVGAAWCFKVLQTAAIVILVAQAAGVAEPLARGRPAFLKPLAKLKKYARGYTFSPFFFASVFLIYFSSQIGLGDCLDRKWEVTDSFFGGSHGTPADERCRIDRPYARVSREKMQANLKSRLSALGVTKIRGKVEAKTVRHYPCLRQQ